MYIYIYIYIHIFTTYKLFLSLSLYIYIYANIKIIPANTNISRQKVISPNSQKGTNLPAMIYIYIYIYWKSPRRLSLRPRLGLSAGPLKILYIMF